VPEVPFPPGVRSGIPFSENKMKIIIFYVITILTVVAAYYAGGIVGAELYPPHTEQTTQSSAHIELH